MLIQMKSRFQGRLPSVIGFDLDGTLVDSAPDLAAAINQMLVDLGRPAAPIESVREWVGNGAAMLVKRALVNSVNSTLVDTVTDAEFEPAMKMFGQRYAEENGRQAKLYPGVHETLMELGQHSIPLVLVTNKPLQFTLPLLRALQLDGVFVLVLGGECLPRKKPDPMPLLHICEQLQVEPARSLFVGDSRNDVLAARAAGYLSAAVPYGYNHGEPITMAQPDWMLESMSQLLA